MISNLEVWPFILFTANRLSAAGIVAIGKEPNRTI